MTIRTYRELVSIETFEGRYNYLRLDSVVGRPSFGFDRYLNQALYASTRWRSVRDFVTIRDNGMDMAHNEHPIGGRIIIHHMNPITIEDIERENEMIFDPEFLVSVSNQVHNAIHYGDEKLLPKPPIVRTVNDTCPWRRKEDSSFGQHTEHH